jgi:glycosyltransferase involved in cell wall biosynthesis
LIYWDQTKSSRWGHRSGLGRVSMRLAQALGDRAIPCRWEGNTWRDSRGRRISPSSEDWVITPEVFAPDERKGWQAWLQGRSCKVGAIFHDAIPLTHPQITWPQSVARHPLYMASLASYDKVWAVSDHSREQLIGFWRWQGATKVPPVVRLQLGADFVYGLPRRAPAVSALPLLLSVGIVEPRKNQELLLEVAEQLHAEGVAFELHLVGRENPHFGGRIVERIKRCRRQGVPVEWHARLSDPKMLSLYARARLLLCPSKAEGCGLPLLEGLWMGVPVLASGIASLTENAVGGGVRQVECLEEEAWREWVKRILSDKEKLWQRMAGEIAGRTLPQWNEAAEALLRDTVSSSSLP